jgi:hypothetical protein
VTARELLRYVAVILGAVRDMPGLSVGPRDTLEADAAALRVIASRLDEAMAVHGGCDMDGDTHCVLARLDADIPATPPPTPGGGMKGR